MLEEAGLQTLTTALSDKEAFRALFFRGGALKGLSRRQVSGITAAQALVDELTDEISRMVG